MASKAGVVVAREKSPGKPAYRGGGVRRKGGVSLARASMRNVGTCHPDVKGEAQVGGPRKSKSTEAGGQGRSRAYER